MGEKLVFILPDSLEAALYALVTMVQYLTTRFMMARASKQVYVICRWPELHDFVRACWVHAEVFTEPTPEMLKESDFTFYFDEVASYAMTKEIMKHIGDSFGIKLGVGLLRFLAPVLIETLAQEEPGRVLVVERNEMDGNKEPEWIWPDQNQFINELEERDIAVGLLNSFVTFEQMKLEIARASVIIGVRGAATIIAAAAHKMVIELSPKEMAHVEWVRKKECRQYKILYGSLQSLSSDLVLDVMEKAVRQNRIRNLPVSRTELEMEPAGEQDVAPIQSEQ